MKPHLILGKGTTIKNKKLALGLVLSGHLAVAWACSERPLNLFQPMDVGWSSIFSAYIAGYSNPVRAAALANLDNWGRSTYGSDWKRDKFKGHVTYEVDGGIATGRYIVYEEVDCDKEAIDKAESTSGEMTGPGSGGSGGSGGYSLLPGGRILWGGQCVYGCTGIATVGELETP